MDSTKAKVLDGMRVLVVDDSEMIVHVLKRSLQAAGCQTLTASDGVEALKILETESVNAVITDVLMPKMDGIKLTTEIKKKYKILPVFIITGYADKLSLKEARQLGAEDLLIKPFKNFALICALQVANERLHQAALKLPPK